MNIWKVITSAPKDLQAAQDLITRVVVLHDNPKFQALMQSDPDIKAQADKISQDARTISESFA